MADELIKFEKYSELKALTKDNPKIVILNMKDGSKYYLLDSTKLSEYSTRSDVASYMFLYEGDEDSLPEDPPEQAPVVAEEKVEEVKKEEEKVVKKETKKKVEKQEPIAEVTVLPAIPVMVDAGTPETVATVIVPQKETAPVTPPPPANDLTSLPVLMGLVSGAVSSIGMPAIMNMLKGKLKGKGKEEAEEEAGDCKTHQVKCNARSKQLSARISAIEQKSEENGEFSLSSDSLEELVQRIEKLEKLSKKGKK
jgi:hypothetical protein